MATLTDRLPVTRQLTLAATIRHFLQKAIDKKLVFHLPRSSSSEGNLLQERKAKEAFQEDLQQNPETEDAPQLLPPVKGKPDPEAMIRPGVDDDAREADLDRRREDFLRKLQQRFVLVYIHPRNQGQELLGFGTDDEALLQDFIQPVSLPFSQHRRGKGKGKGKGK